MARLQYADDMTGERIANFYIGREWHEVYASQETYYGVQCENCGNGELGADFRFLSGLAAKLTCTDCGAEFYEVMDPHTEVDRVIGHLLRNR
jgi:predicted nucleic-acid-binding Zn-ribbon protein